MTRKRKKLGKLFKAVPFKLGARVHRNEHGLFVFADAKRPATHVITSVSSDGTAFNAEPIDKRLTDEEALKAIAAYWLSLGGFCGTEITEVDEKNNTVTVILDISDLDVSAVLDGSHMDLQSILEAHKDLQEAE